MRRSTWWTPPAGSSPASRRRSRSAAPPTRPPASCSTSATARTRTRRARSTSCDACSATRSHRSTSPSAPRTRSPATWTSSIAGPGGSRAARRSRSPSRPSWPHEVALRRDQLLEAAAEADDAVFEKYLGEEDISDAELDACLHKGVRESILAPVLVASASKGIGLNALLDAIVRYLPSPEEEGPYAAQDKAGKDVTVEAAADGPLLVRVFKTAADPFVGRLTYLRVLSGTLRSQGGVFNATKGEDERIGQLLYLHGKEQEPAAELRAGEIGAVAKLGVTETGDTLVAARPRAPSAGDRVPLPDAPGGDRAAVQGRPGQDGPGAQRACWRRSRPPASSAARPASRSCGRSARRTSRSSASVSSASSGPRSSPARPRSPTARRSAARPRRTAATRSRPAATGCSATSGSSCEPNPAAGVEFAEKVVGGIGPEGVLRGHREGRPRDGRRRRAGRLPARRLQGDALRRLVPPGGLQRALVQDRGLDGRSRTASCRRSRCSSSRS